MMSKPPQSAKLTRMKMRLIMFCSALSIAWGVAVWGQEDDFVSLLLGFHEGGILCATQTDTTRAAPDTVAGTTHVVEEAPPFVSNGRFVPAVLGIGFGVRAGLTGDQGQEGVLMSVTHPPFADGGVTEQSFYTYVGSATDPGITFYQFDYGYELALGDWTMTASVNGVTLYETTFTVVPPAALPELAGVCGYTDLLS